MRESHEVKAKAGMCHFLAEQNLYVLSRLQSPSLYLSFADRSLSANIRYYKQLSLKTLQSLIAGNGLYRDVIEDIKREIDIAIKQAAADEDLRKRLEEGQAKDLKRLSENETDSLGRSLNYCNYASHNWRWFMTPDNIDSPGEMICGDICGTLVTVAERVSEETTKPGDAVRTYELGEWKVISPEKKLLSPDNYYTHKWRTYITPSTPDSPPESIHMCGICGIEDLGSPEEFDINYPPCEPA